MQGLQELNNHHKNRGDHQALNEARLAATLQHFYPKMSRSVALIKARWQMEQHGIKLALS